MRVTDCNERPVRLTKREQEILRDVPETVSVGRDGTATEGAWYFELPDGKQFRCTLTRSLAAEFYSVNERLIALRSLVADMKDGIIPLQSP